MSKHLISPFRDQINEDVYVICSGKSMDYVDPSFFKNKFCVGVNLSYRKFPVQCVVMKEHHCGQRVIDEGQSLITSEFEFGDSKFRRNDFNGDYYYYRHRDKDRNSIDFSVVDTDDMLIVGWSTVVTAIHFAYYLGSRNIIVCGADGGSIDGQHMMNGYLDGYDIPKPELDLCNDYSPYEKTNLECVNYFRSLGCNVVGFNPFLNPNLEGHTYAR